MSHRGHILGHHHHTHRLHTTHRVGEHQSYQNKEMPPSCPVIAYPAAVPQSSIPYVYGNQAVPYGQPSPVYVDQQRLNLAIADRQRHKKNEKLGGMGAVAAGAFAMYEAHEAKVDPAHARKHKLEAKLAGTVAVGSAGYAVHEHREKKKSEHLIQQLTQGRSHGVDGQEEKPKHHHLFW